MSEETTRLMQRALRGDVSVAETLLPRLWRAGDLVRHAEAIEYLLGAGLRELSPRCVTHQTRVEYTTDDGTRASTIPRSTLQWGTAVLRGNLVLEPGNPIFDDPEGLTGLMLITGSLVVHDPPLRFLESAFRSLRYVGGAVAITGVRDETLALPRLVVALGDIQITSSGMLRQLAMPALRTAGGLALADLPELRRVAAPALRLVDHTILVVGECGPTIEIQSRLAAPERRSVAERGVLRFVRPAEPAAATSTLAPGFGACAEAMRQMDGQPGRSLWGWWWWYPLPPDRGSEHVELLGPRVQLGSSPECDLVKPDLAPRHLELVCLMSEWRYFAVQSELHDGAAQVLSKPLGSVAELFEQDPVQLGPLPGRLLTLF